MNTAKIHVFDANEDKGWLGNDRGYQWWFEPEFEHSFCIFDIEAFYEQPYFANDHVGPHIVKAYVDHVLHYGSSLLGRPVESVLELGCGGGWFSEEFLKRGVDLIAVEGTLPGYKRTLARGVPAERLIRHDLRLPLALKRQFDIAVCTEVAEHIECPFSSQFVQNMVNHAPVVWFSFEEPGRSEAHYHHCNVQPEKFWVNLFAFHGFKTLRLPEEVTRAVELRGDLVLYREGITIPSALAGDATERTAASESLGRAAARSHAPAGLKSVIKQLTPPILWEGLRRFRRAAPANA